MPPDPVYDGLLIPLPELMRAVHAAFGALIPGGGPGGRYVFIAALSLAGAAISLFLFKTLSDQPRIGLLRNRIQGNILQISLYPDRFDIIAGCLRSILADTGCTLRESLVPLAVIAVPLALLMLEVNAWCGYSPFSAGSEFVIRAETGMAGAPDLRASLMAIGLEASPEIRLVTDALRIPAERSVYWRARLEAVEAGAFIRIRNADGRMASRTVAAGHTSRLFGPSMVKWSLPAALTASGEGFLPEDAPVSAIELSYPRADYPILFWHVDALALFVILTLVIAAVLKPFMGVRI
jgi:hypothetical protein